MQCIFACIRYCEILNRTTSDTFTCYFILEGKIISQEEIQNDNDYFFIVPKTIPKEKTPGILP